MGVCVCVCVRACTRVCSHLACEEERDESVRLLVSAGADATLLNQVMLSTSITLNSVTVDIHHRTTAVATTTITTTPFNGLFFRDSLGKPVPER